MLNHNTEAEAESITMLFIWVVTPYSPEDGNKMFIRIFFFLSPLHGVTAQSNIVTLTAHRTSNLTEREPIQVLEKLLKSMHLKFTTIFFISTNNITSLRLPNCSINDPMGRTSIPKMLRPGRPSNSTSLSVIFEYDKVELQTLGVFGANSLPASEFRVVVLLVVRVELPPTKSHSYQMLVARTFLIASRPR